MLLVMSDRSEPPTDDPWDPARYERFRVERERPVQDLLAMTRPAPGGRVVDLGCGTGRYLTALAERTGAETLVGLDSSPRMLAEARAGLDPAATGTTIELVEGDLRQLSGSWDVIFSNAAIQWLGDHPGLLDHLAGRLAPGGQLAVQLPANFDHPSHRIADDVGRQFGLEPLARDIGALSPARYAELLWDVGLREVDLVLRVYGNPMERTEDVIAWVSGTLLTSFEKRLDAEAFTEFRAEYRTQLLDALGDPSGQRPYFYAFPRILFTARRPT